MRTIILLIVSVFYSLSAYSQDFIYFDEEVSGDRIKLILKGSNYINYSNRKCFIEPGIDLMKKMGDDFFQIFDDLKPEDEPILRTMDIHIRFSNKLKADYFMLDIRKQDRAYVLHKENQFYRWARTFDDMQRYKSFIFFDPDFDGAPAVIFIRGFYMHR